MQRTEGGMEGFLSLSYSHTKGNGTVIGEGRKRRLVGVTGYRKRDFSLLFMEVESVGSGGKGKKGRLYDGENSFEGRRGCGDFSFRFSINQSPLVKLF